MPRTRAPRNFEVLSFRRRGFSTTRSPSPGAVSTDGRLVTVIDTSNPPSEWQKAAGYFVPAKQAMIQIYPRPNAETSTNARHRWAYYDGSNPIQYRIPLGVAFGSFPFHFEVLIGPAGLTVGASDGVVTWTPSGSYTNEPVTIRVTDQDGITPLDITWTISTSSSTSRFIFVDAVNGSNVNSGTIGSPRQTLTNVFGSTYSATANAGAQAYLRTGTYTMPGYTDNEITSSVQFFQLHSGRKPASLMAYPNETVTLTGGRFAVGDSANDFFFQGLNFDGGLSVKNFRLFWLWASRNVFDGLRWTNASAGLPVASNEGDNATMFFGGDGSFVDYTLINNCHESGRVPVSGQANNYGFCSFYSRRYMLIQYSSFVGSCNAAMYLKGTNVDVCVQCCDLEAIGDVENMASEGFQSPNRIEWRYNKFKAPEGSVSWHTFESSTANLWTYRNTYYGTRLTNRTAGGPFVSNDNVIVTNVTPRVPASWTNTGTECQGGLNAGIVDSTTLALTGTYRTNYLGRRGHEISA